MTQLVALWLQHSVQDIGQPSCLLSAQVYYVNMEHRKIILFTSSPSYT